MKKDDNKSTRKLILLIAVFFSLMIVLSLIFLPYINLLTEPQTQQKFREWVTSFGVGGWLLVLSIQIKPLLKNVIYAVLTGKCPLFRCPSAPTGTFAHLL